MDKSTRLMVETTSLTFIHCFHETVLNVIDQIPNECLLFNVFFLESVAILTTNLKE